MAFTPLPSAQNGSSVLLPKTQMQLGQYLQSPNKRWMLRFNEDSDLVLSDGDIRAWSAYKDTPYSTQVYPQRYDAGEYSRVTMFGSLGLRDLQRGRQWQATTSTPLDGNTAAAQVRTFTQLQDDGNLVSIDAIPVWATNKSIPVTPDVPAAIIPPGSSMTPGEELVVGSYWFKFQTDGNLVLYGADNSVVWASYTENKAASLAVMQTDGNFVIYDNAGKALWNTGTTAFPGAHARIQANGSFSIVVHKVVWARFGYTPLVKARAVYYPDHTKDELKTFYSRVLYTF
ncbi:MULTISPECIES: putidacin L1 family lectin-like bacteriocin [unclassified Pseudomonas]|uniref:putidacin L1 family lectin-like bacteriocin n=1 Tax=unclassified Pseudomonas TaxID=196821 RepID=UPI002600088C|nr:MULTISPECIES: putidacin L1 family lectin-like bacteriocin [unclassified Pseudomonas]